jgi:uncharacterized protein YbaP (TraB family)
MRLNELVKREQERELQRILQQAKLDKRHMSKGSEWGLSSSHVVTSNITSNNINNNNNNNNIINNEASNFSKSQSTHNLNSHLHHQKKLVS